MRRLTLKKKSGTDAAGHPDAVLLAVLQREAGAPRAVAPRLRCLLPRPGGAEGGEHGQLVVGHQHLFFFADPEEGALPTESQNTVSVGLAGVTRWGRTEDGGMEVACEGGDSWRWRSDGGAGKDVWGSEAVCFMDMQVLRAQREEQQGKLSFFFSFLERQDDDAGVEVEASLKDLAAEDTLLFDMRVLSSRPEALSASATFFNGSDFKIVFLSRDLLILNCLRRVRFIAQWSLGTKKSPCVAIVGGHGVVLLLPQLSVWTCFFFAEIKSCGCKKGSLSLRHAPKEGAERIHTFFTPAAEQMETAIRDAIETHFREKRAVAAMPLLYPPAVPPSWAHRVGEGGAEAQGERSKTIAASRQKTARHQLRTIRSKKLQVDRPAVDYAAAALGVEEEEQ